MAERFGTCLPNARIPIPLAGDVLFASGLDARQSQLLPKNGGQLLHRQLDFQNMSAGLIAGPGILFPVTRAQRRSGLTFSLPDSARSLRAVAKLRNIDLRQGNADRVVALL